MMRKSGIAQRHVKFMTSEPIIVMLLINQKKIRQENGVLQLFYKVK